MFILKTGHQPGVYVPLRALFLVWTRLTRFITFVQVSEVLGKLQYKKLEEF